MNEADTCRTYIIPKLKSAGWEDDTLTEQSVLTPGRIVPIGDRHTRKECLRPDYVLFMRQNFPIVVMAANAEYAHPNKNFRRTVAYLDGLPPLGDATHSRKETLRSPCCDRREGHLEERFEM